MQAMARTRIRLAAERDLPAIRSVLERANEAFRGMVAEPLFESYLRSVLDVERRAREAEVLAADLDGRLVGTITFYRDATEEGMPVRFPSGTSGIRATAVDPSARGQGIGRALVEACIQRAVLAGATGVGLHTATFMTSAVALYERTGFRRAPELDLGWARYFPSPTGDDAPAIAYLRPIS
jgi:ribosomal protein S18 acetylase RimI-like enzyme